MNDLGSRCNDKYTASYYSCPTYCEYNVSAASAQIQTTADALNAAVGSRGKEEGEEGGGGEWADWGFVCLLPFWRLVLQPSSVFS